MTIPVTNNHQFLPFKLPIKPETFTTLLKTESTFMSDTQTEVLIREGWEKVTRRMSERNWPYFDGPLVRVERVEDDESGIIVVVATGATYRQVIGLRAHASETYVQLSKSQLPNALSVIALIKTSDNQLVLNQRASGDWEVSHELIGGFVRVGTTDLVTSINSFMAKDLSINDTDIAQHNLHSIGHYPAILETMVVFDIALNITLAELLLRGNNAETVQAINIENEAEDCVQKAVSGLVMHPPSLTILAYRYSK
ncbi:MAG: hypothetical protein RLZZ230_182 [Candidatus Parcubacteria bacterium]|jgi:hypothetical protein